MIVRVRHPKGIQRIEIDPPKHFTIADLLNSFVEFVPGEWELYDESGHIFYSGEEIFQEIGIQHGDLLIAKEKEKPKGKEKVKEKKKRARKEEVLEPTEFVEEVIDYRIVARELMEDFEKSKNMMAFRAYAQTVGVRRVEAVLKEKVQFEQVCDQEGNLKKLKVAFGGLRDTEIVPFYSKEFLLETFGHILSIYSTKSRRKSTVSSHVFNAEEIARKNPPVFWSVIYQFIEKKDPDQKLQTGEKLQQIFDFLVREAEDMYA